MLVFLLAGSAVNALFVYYYGFSLSVFGGVLNPQDWRLFAAWVLLYPLAWSLVATYALPMKLRASPFDLQLVTALLLGAVYTYQYPIFLRLPVPTLTLAALNGILLMLASIFQTPLMASIIGLGVGGQDNYDYDSFMLRGKKLSDFKELYESDRYRQWLRVPELTIVKDTEKGNGQKEDDRIVLSSAGDSDLRTFVFVFNHPEGLYVQMVSFERGKYWIFKSARSQFVSTQIKRTILSDLKAEAGPFVNAVEKDTALFFALRETRSVAGLRGLERRDKIMVSIGAILLGILFYGVVLLGWNVENSVGLAFFIVLGVAAELSYRKLHLATLWSRTSR